MKLYSILFLIIPFGFLSLNTCGSSKKLLVTPDQYKDIILSKPIDSTENFVFKKQVHLLPGKKMIIKADETNRLYTELVKNKDHVVLVISFIRRARKNIADGNMEYSVYFNLPSPIPSRTWKDSELEDLQAVSAFYAFHPQSGVKKLKQGYLKVEVNSKYKTLQIDFQSNEVDKNLNGTYTIDLKKFVRTN